MILLDAAKREAPAQAELRPPAGIEQETAIDDLPSLRFLVFGSSSDRVFLGDEVTRTGKRFALPRKAQPANQIHGGCIV